MTSEERVEGLTDNRPIIEPNLLSFRELNDCANSGEFMEAMRATWGDEPKWARLTIVSDDHPLPPYPNGWYFEGWSVAPSDCVPPGRMGPFNYPLIAQPSPSPITEDL